MNLTFEIAAGLFSFTQPQPPDTKVKKGGYVKRRRDDEATIMAFLHSFMQLERTAQC